MDNLIKDSSIPPTEVIPGQHERRKIVVTTNPETQSRVPENSLKKITTEFLAKLRIPSEIENQAESESKVGTVLELLSSGAIDKETAKKTLGDMLAALKHENEVLKTQAKWSEKTDTLNQKGFEEIAIRVIDAAKKLETPEPVSIAFVDLAGFKGVNDRLKHNIGDLVIRSVADYLVTCVRKGDIVAHKQGDEYLILFVNMTADDAKKRMTGFRDNETPRLMQMLLEQGKMVLGDDGQPLIDPNFDLSTVPISMSIGVANIDLTQPPYDAMIAAINVADKDMHLDHARLMQQQTAFNR